jgi:hypothetical protein
MWREVDWVISPEKRSEFFATDGVFRGEQWRKKLAALNTKYKIGLSSNSFGYTSDGAFCQSNEDTLSFAVKGGAVPSTVRLVASSSAAAQELEDVSHAILAALIMETRSNVQMFARSGEYSAARLPYPKSYMLGQLVVGDKGKPGRTLWTDMVDQVRTGKPWPEVADRALPRLIADAITDTLREDMDAGCDPEGSVAERLASMIHSETNYHVMYRAMRDLLGVRVTQVEQTFTLTREFRGKKIPRYLLVGVHFTAKVDLAGAFFAGKDRVNGYGRITSPVLRASHGNVNDTEVALDAVHQ